jgi:hypothetical protein
MNRHSLPASDTSSGASAGWMRALPWLALFAAATFCTYYYLQLKEGFFDDVYIYLAIARNAIDYGSWQYQPGIVDRSGLLASSPAHIAVLTLAAGVSELIGHGERTLLDAKVTLLLSGFVAWGVFLPFWRRRLPAYAWLGTTLMLLATCLDTMFEFEGGLLMLWVSTLVVLARDQPGNLRPLSWLLPMGPLIRPDLTLPILLLCLVHWALQRDRLLPQIKGSLMPMTVLAVTWITLCTLLDVWPIPVTYWGKSAMPFLFDKVSLMAALPERLGISLLLRAGLSPMANAVVGWVCILTVLTGLLLSRPRISWLAILAMVCTYMLVFRRMPANFWWYYQNILSLMIGMFLGRALSAPPQDPQRVGASVISLILIAALCFGRMPNDGPQQWRTSEQTRAQGYLSLSVSGTGRGTFELPGLGEFILRNPEIGMISYYSQTPIFQWDSAGLVQPLDHPLVAKSHMRHFYPRSLRRAAQVDAQGIVDRAGHPIPVLDVWAMENRRYGDARKSCHWVLPQQALCINQYRMLLPTDSEEDK